MYTKRYYLLARYFEVYIQTPGCATNDAYGSNDCDFHWGKDIIGSINATLGQDITSTAKLVVDMKVDSFIPFKFSCAMCGANCTITIPIVKKTIEFAMPACPIVKGAVASPLSFTMPAKAPIDMDIKVKGSVSVVDGSTTLAKIDINAEMNGDAMVVTTVAPK